MKTESSAERLTLRQLCDRIGGCEPHNVDYAIRSARIEPVQMAGVARLFSADQIPLVKAALDEVAKRRCGPKPTRFTIAGEGMTMAATKTKATGPTAGRWPELMSDLDVAAYLSVGRRTAWKLSATGVLPQPVKLGSSTRWRKCDLDTYLAKLAG